MNILYTQCNIIYDCVLVIYGSFQFDASPSSAVMQPQAYSMGQSMMSGGGGNGGQQPHRGLLAAGGGELLAEQMEQLAIDGRQGMVGGVVVGEGGGGRQGQIGDGTTTGGGLGKKKKMVETGSLLL